LSSAVIVARPCPFASWRAVKQKSRVDVDTALSCGPKASGAQTQSVVQPEGFDIQANLPSQVHHLEADAAAGAGLRALNECTQDAEVQPVPCEAIDDDVLVTAVQRTNDLGTQGTTISIVEII